MKRTVKLLCAWMLTGTLCAVCVACNDGGESKEPERPVDNAMTPVSVTDKIADFLSENLDAITQASLYNYDDQGKLASLVHCVMINSMNDLPEIENSDGILITYPEIDFNSNTLVIGQWTGSDAGKYLMSQSVCVEQDVATIDLTVGSKKEGDFAQVVTIESFWGLYPKIDAKTIQTNVTYND